jgi:hypothetical protein
MDLSNTKKTNNKRILEENYETKHIMTNFTLIHGLHRKIKQKGKTLLYFSIW